MRLSLRIRQTVISVLLFTVFHTSPVSAASNKNGEKLILRPVFADSMPAHPSFLARRQLRRAQVGLALSGGGARGLSQIGVLQELIAASIPIDYIVGTSMGSIIGGFYAAGYSPDEIEQMVKSVDWSSILSDRPARRTLFINQKQNSDRLLLQIRLDRGKPYIPPALTPGQRIQSILTEFALRAEYISSQDFDQMRIPFRAVATDLITGEKVLIGSGDLAEAMRASMAFPLLFTPVPFEGRLLVDGGMSDNIPAEDVRNFAADYVIGVDATSNLREEGELNMPWEIADQVTSIMQRDMNTRSRSFSDIVLRVDDPGRTNMDFGDLDRLIELGRTVTRQNMPKIKDDLSRLATRFRQADSLLDFRITRFSSNQPELQPKLKALLAANGSLPHISNHTLLRFLSDSYKDLEYLDIYAELLPDSLGYHLHVVAQNPPVLQQIVISGNRVISADTLISALAPLLSKPLKNRESEFYLQQMIEKYRQKGYSLAKIQSLAFNEEQGIATIVIDEGEIAEIKIEGLNQTQSHVVEREMSLKKHDIFNYRKSQNSIRNIFGTGLFRRVSSNIIRAEKGIELRYKLQEKIYQVLNLSGRFDSQRRGQALMEFANENVAGTGGKLSLQGRYGSRDQAVKSSFSLPRIFKTYLTFNVEGYFQRHRHNFYLRRGGERIGKYNKRIWGLSGSVGQLVDRFGLVTAEMHLQNFHLSPLEGFGYPIGTEQINRLTFRSIYDTRDKLPYPHKGRYVEFFYDVSNKNLGSENSFVRFSGTLESFSLLRGRHILHPKFSFGTADITTPFLFQFVLNGPDHIMGLRDDELRGRNFLLTNLEYQYLLFKRAQANSYFGVRYDVGGTWQRTVNASIRDNFSNGWGIYLGMATFLGKIEVAYGRHESGRQRVYFTSGYSF